MLLYLVPQWLLPRMYDWVDTYHLVCAPTIAVFVLSSTASLERALRLECPPDWNGRRPLELEWELSTLPNDWNGN